MTKLALITLLWALPLAAQLDFTSTISLFAVPASAPNTAFLATTTSLYRSDDQGRSYRSVFNSTDTLADLALTTPNTVLLATRSTTKLLYRSTDNGTTFTPVTLPLPAPPSGTYSISIHPLQSSAATIYLRVGRFLLKSTDDGATWTLLPTLFDATSAFAPAPTGNRILYAGNAGSPGGFSVSSDDGSTWTQASAVPLPPNSGSVSIESVFATYIIPHPRTPDLLLINASVSYRDPNAVGGRSTGSSFYRSTDRGRTWSYSGPSGLGSRTVLSRDGALLLVAGSSPVRSTDFGLSYTSIPNNGPTFFIDGANSSRVWTSNGQLSTNGGVSFSAFPRKYYPAGADVEAVELTLEAGSSFGNYFGFIDADGSSLSVAPPAPANAPAWFSYLSSSSEPANGYYYAIRAGSLAPGDYTATITFSSPNFSNSPRFALTLHVVAKIDPQLRYRTRRLAGTGSFAYSGDNGSALSAGFACCITSLTSAPDSTIFTADSTRIRRITPIGTITTIAGSSQTGTNGAGDGDSAVNARFRRITGIHFANGQIYVADSFDNRIRRFTPGGTIETIFAAGSSAGLFSFGFTPILRTAPNGDLYLGNRDNIYKIENGRATALLNPALPAALVDFVFTPEGEILVASTTQIRRIRLSPSVTSTVIAGSPKVGFAGDHGPAMRALFARINAIAIDRNGNIIVIDGDRVRAILPSGIVQTIAGNGEPYTDLLGATPVPDNSLADSVAFPSPYSLNIDAANRLYVAAPFILYQFTPNPITAPTPSIAANGVVSLAAGARRVAPGGIFSVYGTNLASTSASNSSVPLPGAISGTQVLAAGRPLPLFYVSPGQINAQMPTDQAAGTVQIQVFREGALSNSVSVEVTSAQPDLLVYSGNRSIAINPDGSLNGPGAAAAGGDVVVVYLTGLGVTSPPLASGAASPTSPLATATGPVSATIGGAPASVAFLGLTPGFVALAQANIQIPNGLAPGDADLILTVRSIASNTAKLTLK